MKAFKYLSAGLLVVVIFYFIGNNLYTNWNKLSEITLNWNYGYVLISLLMLILAWLFAVKGLKMLFSEFGYDVSFKQVYIIYFRSIGGKYLPGKLWQIAGSTYFASKAGIPEGISFTTFLVGQVYSVLAALIMFGAMLLVGGFEFQYEILEHAKWTSIPVVIGLIVFALRPAIIEKNLNFLLRKLKREQVKLKFSMVKALWFTLYFGFCWFVFGVAFWFFAGSIFNVPIIDVFGLSVIIATAVVIGFLALITPGGLGVREGIMILLLTSFGGYPNPLPAALAIGFRVLITISEIISSIPAWISKPDNTLS